MTFRLLSRQDIPAARQLWHICFPEDSEAFLDWFFVSGRIPELSVGCFENGSLVSAIHGSEMPLRCGEETVSALMVSGVGTLPEKRGRGYMHSTMLYLKEKAAERGIRILFNHPQDPNAYKRLGFLPCTDTLYVDQPAEMFIRKPDTALIKVPFSQPEALSLYQRVSRRYSAFSMRDAHAFSLRTCELTLDGGEAYLFAHDDIPVAYCFLRRNGATVIIEEILSITDYFNVLSNVCQITGCTHIRAKLPPETDLPGERHVQNIMLTEPRIYEAFGYGKALCYSVDEY